MQVDFISQPFHDGTSLFDFITEVSADTAVDRFDVVVAWVKRSGLRRVENELRAMRDRGVELRIIIGIDQGGATEQGLDMARELFDDVYVFHDRSGRTFHSKVYFAAGPSAANALVGSHNLTAGGVYFNYEAGVRLALTSPEDDETIASLVEYFERLKADDACISLTDELLDELKNNPRYRVANEDENRKVSVDENVEDVDAEVDLDEDVGTTVAESIFAKSAITKAGPPPITHLTSGGADGGVDKKSTAKKTTAKKVTAKKTVAKQPTATQTGQAVLRRWYKEMSHSDAQQPKTPNSNVKGVMTLNRNRTHPIETATYFRQTFFGGLNWEDVGGGKEQAVFEADVEIDGMSRGKYSFTLDHADSRAAGQGNTTTWLHWGGLGEYMRNNSHVGDVASIERRVDGTFRVVIGGSPSGPFKA